jgi:hypothetical protein
MRPLNRNIFSNNDFLLLKWRIFLSLVNEQWAGQQTAELLKKISPLPDVSQPGKKRNAEVKFLPQVHSRRSCRRNKSAKPRNRKNIVQKQPAKKENVCGNKLRKVVPVLN